MINAGRHRLPRADDRPEQQRLPVDGARWHARRLSHVWPGRRGPAHHEHRRPKAVTTLTDGYDNFPLWSPRGDLIMFSRVEQGDYEIFTIKPDGTGVRSA